MRRILICLILLQLIVFAGLYIGANYEVVNRSLNDTGEVVHGIHTVDEDYSIQYDKSLEENPEYINNKKTVYDRKLCGLKVENTVNIGDIDELKMPISESVELKLDKSLIDENLNINNFDREAIVVSKINNDVIAKQVLCKEESFEIIR